MVTWLRQAAAIVGTVSTTDGRVGRVVLVGPRSAPKGAMLVLTGKDGSSVETVPFADHLALLTADQVVDVLCMQERAFGAGRLARPELP